MRYPDEVRECTPLADVSKRCLLASLNMEPSSRKTPFPVCSFPLNKCAHLRQRQPKYQPCLSASPTNFVTTVECCLSLHLWPTSSHLLSVTSRLRLRTLRSSWGTRPCWAVSRQHWYWAWRRPNHSSPLLRPCPHQQYRLLRPCQRPCPPSYCQSRSYRQACRQACLP